jgi:mannose-1-phosphate guanylyltransferase
MMMLEETVQRVEQVFGIENVFIITSKHLVDPIRDEVPELAAHVLAEPDKRNTAGAILWGMSIVSALLDDENLTFGVFPSDHLIRPAEEFESTISEGLEFAEKEGRLVTVGIAPTRPETGYGYIEKGKAVNGNCSLVARFIEKPEASVAEKLIATKKVFWNGGIFFWSLPVFLQEMEKASPEHARAFKEIVAAVKTGRTVVAEIAFSELPNISIDNALLEKSGRVGLVEATFQWDDIGAWDALERFLETDPDGNAIHGEAFALESAGCVIHNSNPNQVVKILGVEDLVIVATAEAILVCPKGRAQDVKKLAGD